MYYRDGIGNTGPAFTARVSCRPQSDLSEPKMLNGKSYVMADEKCEYLGKASPMIYHNCNFHYKQLLTLTSPMLQDLDQKIHELTKNRKTRLNRFKRNSKRSKRYLRQVRIGFSIPFKIFFGCWIPRNVEMCQTILLKLVDWYGSKLNITRWQTKLILGWENPASYIW